MDEATFEETMGQRDAGSQPRSSVKSNPAGRAVLAGIGALALACDQAEDRFDRAMERGQQVAQAWQDRTDQVRQDNAGARERVGDYFRSAMDVLLNSLNVPSKGDVDTINAKLNIVTRKLDELQANAVRTGLEEPSFVEAEGTAPESPPPPPIDLST